MRDVCAKLGLLREVHPSPYLLLRLNACHMSSPMIGYVASLVLHTISYVQPATGYNASYVSLALFFGRLFTCS